MQKLCEKIGKKLKTEQDFLPLPGFLKFSPSPPQNQGINLEKRMFLGRKADVFL